MLDSFLFYYFFTEKPSRISDDRLLQLKKLFRTKEATENLASKLLDGTVPGGGLGYISNRCYNGQRVDWPEMAFNVLSYWTNRLLGGDEEDLRAALGDI